MAGNVNTLLTPYVVERECSRLLGEPVTARLGPHDYDLEMTITAGLTSVSLHIEEWHLALSLADFSQRYLVPATEELGRDADLMLEVSPPL
jgi:hypothetical protein